MAVSSCEADQPLASDGQGKPPLRTVLVTSAETDLAQAIADHLAATYEVRLTSPRAVPKLPTSARCELLADDAAKRLVQGVDALVHVDDSFQEYSAEEQLDRQTQATYNLLNAAVEADVRRVIYLSALDMMTAYEDDLLVAEDWQPRPTPELPSLGKYLGEFTCREFARRNALCVVVLRLGIVSDDRSSATPQPDPLWVGGADVIQAVTKALATESISDGRGTPYWSVFHILSASARSRFSVAKASRLLGYKPQSWD